MYNILALIGEAGSGKDTILRKLIDDTKHYYNGKLPLHEIISYTSRPPREKKWMVLTTIYLSRKIC